MWSGSIGKNAQVKDAFEKLAANNSAVGLPLDKQTYTLGPTLTFDPATEKFTGDNPVETPMKIYPAVHYSMGGLWVDYERTSEGFLNLSSQRNQRTSIEGLYAVGECDYQYHGANRLGANSLLSCVYAGQIAGPAVLAYVSGRAQAPETPASILAAAEGDARTLVAKANWSI